MIEATYAMQNLIYHRDVPQSDQLGIDGQIALAKKAYDSAVNAVNEFIQEQNSLESLYEKYRGSWGYIVNDKIREVLDKDIRSTVCEVENNRWRRKQAMFQESTRSKINYMLDAIASWLGRHAAQYSDISTDDCPQYNAEALVDAFCQSFPKYN